MRLLFILLALVIIWFALRTYRRRDKSPSAPRSPAAAIDMVRCGHCGTHLPKGEAVARDGQYYCSQAHLEQDTENRGSR